MTRLDEIRGRLAAAMGGSILSASSQPMMECNISDIAYLLARLDAAEKVVTAADSLRKHWQQEFAHFACGGEAQLLEALAAYDAAAGAKDEGEG